MKFAYITFLYLRSSTYILCSDTGHFNRYVLGLLTNIFIMYAKTTPLVHIKAETIAIKFFRNVPFVPVYEYRGPIASIKVKVL